MGYAQLIKYTSRYGSCRLKTLWSSLNWVAQAVMGTNRITDLC